MLLTTLMTVAKRAFHGSREIRRLRYICQARTRAPTARTIDPMPRPTLNLKPCISWTNRNVPIPPVSVILIEVKPKATASAASTTIGAIITMGDSWRCLFSSLSSPKNTMNSTRAMYRALRKAAMRAKARR